MMTSCFQHDKCYERSWRIAVCAVHMLSRYTVRLYMVERVQKLYMQTGEICRCSNAVRQRRPEQKGGSMSYACSSGTPAAVSASGFIRRTCRPCTRIILLSLIPTSGFMMRRLESRWSKQTDVARDIRRRKEAEGGPLQEV